VCAVLAFPTRRSSDLPLALVDSDMPVVTVAPNNELLEKLKSNLQEVSARGGQLLVFADREAQLSEDEQTQVVNMPSIHPVLAPRSEEHTSELQSRFAL